MATTCAVCGKTGASTLRCGRCSSRVYCGNANEADIRDKIGAQCQKKDWRTHKAECKRQNYILKIDLHPRFITNPRVTRTLSCPAAATFASLHQALIVAFGWANTHIYEFDVFNHSDVRGRESRFSGGEPMFKIMEIIEDFDEAFDESDYESDDESSGSSNPDSAKVTLLDILDDPKTKGKTIHYCYDFGDGWEHVISCTGRADATAQFVCLDGEGHGCAEDVGGYIGWQELLEAYDAEKPTKKQKESMSWFETQASNKDAEGLRGEKKWRWDKDKINTVLNELGQSTKAGIAPSPSNSLPSVLLVSLEKQSFFDDMYAEVLAVLRSKANVVEVTHIASAMEHLSRPQAEYAAVVVTDAGVMAKKMVAVQQKLVEYAIFGGTVIIGFHFPTFAPPKDVETFFKDQWNLNWIFKNYHREMFTLNPRAQQDPQFASRGGNNLPRQYSMKAVHLSGTKPEERIYVGEINSAASPAVFAKKGEGFLGWIGDVNTEEGTTELLLYMCGI
ncbi:Uncharacterized protein LAWI1_G004397 [Lachnellula willkommii]|uniref:Plasmid pRiA4b Orf3-like domain-containing protein n=1 Tax=Lachnellula willkommii TaxID=215461 RepID=A0A559MC13_9HELO|nr:Uncharacterized protein LAWI1_G004397 [Lachnellula willkommii]